MERFENGTVGDLSVERKPNIFLGIIGSLIGALLGAAIWVGIYQLGVIAGFAGIAIIYLSCSGYTLLSKSKALNGVIISIIISVLVIVAAHFFCWGLEIFYAYKEEYDITLMKAISSVPSIAFTEDFVVDFIKELLIGLILIGVGSVRFINRAKGSGTQEEVQ